MECRSKSRMDIFYLFYFWFIFAAALQLSMYNSLNLKNVKRKMFERRLWIGFAGATESPWVGKNNLWKTWFSFLNGSQTHSARRISTCDLQLIQTPNLSQKQSKNVSTVTCIQSVAAAAAVCRNCFFSHVTELHWPLILWIIQSCARTLSCFSLPFDTQLENVQPSDSCGTKAPALSVSHWKTCSRCSWDSCTFYVLQRILCKEAEVNEHRPSPTDATNDVSMPWTSLVGLLFSLQATCWSFGLKKA